MAIASCGEKSKSTTPQSTASTTSTTPEVKTSTSTADKTQSSKKGKLVYKQYCFACHGADGKMGVGGAKDLSVSKIPKEEIINQVTNGKGMMTPYKDILSKEQIDAVADYIQELRK